MSSANVGVRGGGWSGVAVSGMALPALLLQPREPCR